jgi:GT2 family glycosyltransferase
VQLSIIIVHYKVKYFLEQCLYAVQKAVKDIDAEILVVDNASQDGSITYLQPKFSSIKFIENTTNIGFGKANNQALVLAKGRFILFLNPDTIIAEDSLQKAIDLLEADKKVGACGIQMLDGGGRFLPESKRAFPNLRPALFKLIGLSALFPTSAYFNTYALGHLPANQNHPVAVLAGAFMMVKREVLDKTGAFDEQFFMYGEDIDLSYRIEKAGYKNYYLGETCILHFKGESTLKGSLNYVQLFYSAMIIFVKKHYTSSGSKVFSSLLQVAIVLRALASVFYRLIMRVIPIKWISSLFRKINQPTIIIGSTAEFKEVMHILTTEDSARKYMHVLPSDIAIISQYKSSEIVFCAGALSYKKILKTIQANINRQLFRFHAVGSNSIVGSDSKETAGHFLSA